MNPRTPGPILGGPLSPSARLATRASRAFRGLRISAGLAMCCGFLAMAMAIAVPGALLAQEPSAEVVLHKGVLKVRRDGQEEFYRQVDVKVPLFESDVLQTGANSRASRMMIRKL